MNETDLRDLLPAERRLPPARRRDMEERLMDQITNDVKVGRRRYRLVVGAVAAALLLVAGVVALSAADDEPGATGPAQEGEDTPREGVRWAPVPEEAAAAMARYEVYGGGGQPYSQSGEIGCIAPIATEAENEAVTGSLDVPLEAAFTRDDIVAACTSAEWTHADPEELDPADATICVSDSPYPQALVAFGGMSCETAHVSYAGAGSTSRPMSDDDLALLNRMRAIDIAAMAMPEVCVTRDSATEWIEALIAEEGLGLEVIVAANEELVQQADELFGVEDVDPAGLCFYGLINWSMEPVTASVYALPPSPDTDYGPPVDITP